MGLHVWLYALPVMVLLAALFARSRREDFDAHYLQTVREWDQKRFIPLSPRDNLVSRLKDIPVQGGERLSAEQHAALLDAIVGWFEAYSIGSKEKYLAFRLPTGIPWRWKPGALEKMSNYFVNGMIFYSSGQMDAWMRRYGHPDNLTNMLPYAEGAKKWTMEDHVNMRSSWIAKYGDGQASLMAHRPSDPFEQWLTIANEHGGTNWWRRHWTGVSLDEMIVRVSVFSQVPPPLATMQVDPTTRRKGYAAAVPFPNLGYGLEHRKSHIEWQFSYDDLLSEQGRIVIADIFAYLRRLPPDHTQPALLRLVYLDAHRRWIPVEMINAHGMKARRHILFF